MDGVVVVDKPRGPTSHDVVRALRKKLGTREAGHAGTLDPMATGVLVVAVGEGTKLVWWLTAGDKSYEATVQLGVATNTLDADGEPTARAPVPADVAARLPAVLDAERARTLQVPPAFSAIHAGGERAHERARRGEAVVLAPRPVAVRALEARLDAALLHVTVTASKGYYVRALARDLAAALGTVGHLASLRRTRAGPFDLGDASPADAPAVLPLAVAAARALPATLLSDAGARDARHGRPVALAELSRAVEGPAAWLHAGALVAVGEIREGAGRVLRGFR